MVAQKSTKVSKYTYAEHEAKAFTGVLGALSTASKEHRRHSIHMATLRAQVRKTAQARKDRLGPQWSNWVGRAVHKLEYQGILEHAEVSGNITMTPTGKKAITTARRSLQLPKNASPTPAQEDMIWKNVSHQLTGRGFKRKQPTTQSEDNNDEEQDDEEEEVLSTSKRSKTKKSSTYRTPPKNAISKMTKFELIAELKSLRRAHEKAETDAQRSTQNADMDEALELLDQLKQREDEIDSLRSELVNAKRSIMRDQTDTQHDGNGASRPTTPEFNGNPSLSRPNPDNVVPFSRAPLSGVIRTQSGSIISQISKHPTPAPSSPGSDRHHDVPFDEDVFGGGGIDVVNHDPSNFLATPESSPVRPSATYKEVELLKDVEKYKALVEQLTQIGNFSQGKIQALERTLDTRTQELQTLEQKVARGVETERSIQADYDTRISVLQAQLEDIQQQASAKETAISAKDVQISDLQAAIADLGDSTDSKQVEHSIAVQELEVVIYDLKNEKQVLADQLADVQRTLSETERTIAGQLDLLQRADDRSASLQTAIDTMQAKLDEERSSNNALREARLRLQEDVQAHLATSSALKGEIETLSRMAAELRLAVQGAQDLQATTAAEVADLSSRNTSLSEEVATLKMSKASVLQQLLEAHAKQSRAEAELSDALSSIEGLDTRISAMQNELADSRSTEANLNTLLSQVQQREQAARSEVVSLESRIISLDERLEVSTNKVKDLELILVAKDQVISDLNNAKDMAVSEISSLSIEARQTAERLSGLEELLESTKVALDRSNANAEHLGQDLALGERQRQDLVTKVQSAGSEIENLKEQGADRLGDIKTLLSELNTVKRSAEGYRVALELANKQRATDAVNYQTSVSTLQDSISGANAELTCTKSELDALNSTQASTKSALERARAELEAGQVRTSALEKDVLDAVRRAQEAEDEVLDLKRSKETDEGTIEGLKAAFEGLRKVQMASLAEFDSKVVSAQSSPMPDRRGSRIGSNV